MKLLNKSISLENYTRAYLDESLRWFSNEELRRLTCTPPVTKDVQIRFFESLPNRTDYYIWGVSLDGRRIGACGLKHVTKNEAEYWGYIGETELWGKGLGASIVTSCLDIAKRMGIHSVYLNVLPNNKRAHKLYLSLGFVEISSNSDGLIKMIKLI